jgi:polysaccharide deacetylase 2 family uncharacterized protein YibQ
MNYMGARFSGETTAMQPMLAELAKRGLLYFDDGSAARSLAPAPTSARLRRAPTATSPR